MASTPAVQPRRVLADLAELARLTGGEDGAQRVAWTPGWQRGRDLLRARLAEIGLAAIEDEAGNLWGKLPGRREQMLVLGSHLDSVPGGGPLDGALGVLAGLEVLRALIEANVFPDLTVSVVDWADEEGARFGRSLLGSSAAAATLDLEAVRGLRDADGVTLEEALARCGVDVERLPAAPTMELDRTLAYLELHIEQGPVLEQERLPVAAVSGTIGVERFVLGFTGRPDHAGSTPMNVRHDALLAAAATALEVERIALRHAGRATTGSLAAKPGVPTVVAGSAELSVDLRNAEAEELARMRVEVLGVARSQAAARGCELAERHLFAAAPRAFDPDLVEAVRSACAEVGGREEPLLSGALHDATEIAALVPSAMVFCPSIGGRSHGPDERTEQRDLRTAIEVFGEVATGIAVGETGLAGTAYSNSGGRGTGSPSTGRAQ
jgi:hydantoinase/carbamoylase family amidase